MRAPCKDCPERTLGYHSKCEKYLAFQEAQNRIYEKRLINMAVEEVITNGIKQVRKRKRRRKEAE